MIRYAHTNIIAEDWKRLASFYEQVFDCIQVPPLRDLQGEWLSKGTGVHDAHLRGVHLRLPGHGEAGPTLEIYSYTQMEDKPKPEANRKGLGHLAFEVDDVDAIAKKVLKHHGKALGEIVQHEVRDVGLLTFTYMTDPEGNILELQQWSRPLLTLTDYTPQKKT